MTKIEQRLAEHEIALGREVYIVDERAWSVSPPRSSDGTRRVQQLTNGAFFDVTPAQLEAMLAEARADAEVL